MGEVSIIGLDLAKNVFQAHGAAADGAVVFRRKLSRAQLLKFMAAQPPCVVAMEACASAHHWGRAIGDLGHEVRLIPPAYVKPFVKRQKNDTPSSPSMMAARRPTCAGPVGATMPCSAKCARKALIVWVRWRTRRSRVR